MYACASRVNLIKTLNKCGILEKSVSLEKITLTKIISSVHSRGIKAKEFQIRPKSSDLLSILLLNFVLDYDKQPIPLGLYVVTF